MGSCVTRNSTLGGDNKKPIICYIEKNENVIQKESIYNADKKINIGSGDGFKKMA